MWPSNIWGLTLVKQATQLRFTCLIMMNVDVHAYTIIIKSQVDRGDKPIEDNVTDTSQVSTIKGEGGTWCINNSLLMTK